ncbi:hypothetical protein [Gallibacterium anatis]|uniref:Uncharacterized protein n=2 Tax=Gallibacterium anatis TaxID=750 RepID=U1I6P0_9PAST|nr:hypothetical protein [Gallibacterium anatis]ERF77879.1 hypothetical protein N561_09120 [Gallibacterium anatis 12656/12]HJF73552.1 hypothetical protein [Gallibacterium anatis]
METDLHYRLFDSEIQPFGEPPIQPRFLKQLEQLKCAILQAIGQLKSMHVKPYFIYQQRYIQLLFKGINGQFHLTLNIAGYTQFPDFSLPKLRFYLDVMDEFDAYHLIDTLHHLLRGKKLSTTTVDNTVNHKYKTNSEQ